MMRLGTHKYRMLMVILMATIASSALLRLSANGRDATQARRVERITFEPAGCKLHWVVSSGEVQNGQFASRGAPEEYSIDFHAAEMTHNGNTHKFSGEEAFSVHQFVLRIVLYAAESVEWFEKEEQSALRASRPNDARTVNAATDN